MRLPASPNARWLAGTVAWLLLLAIAALARTSGQEPRSTPDSRVYLEIAAQPLRFEHLYYPKPFTVPALYRLVGATPASVASFQLGLAIRSWAALAAVLWSGACSSPAWSASPARRQRRDHAPRLRRRPAVALALLLAQLAWLDRRSIETVAHPSAERPLSHAA